MEFVDVDLTIGLDDSLNLGEDVGGTFEVDLVHEFGLASGVWVDWFGFGFWNDGFAFWLGVGWGLVGWFGDGGGGDFISSLVNRNTGSGRKYHESEHGNAKHHPEINPTGRLLLFNHLLLLKLVHQSGLLLKVGTYIIGAVFEALGDFAEIVGFGELAERVAVFDILGEVEGFVVDLGEFVHLFFCFIFRVNFYEIF